MLYLWNLRWLCLYFILEYINISYVRTDWPSSPSSNIQLLGLFHDISNTTGSSTLPSYSNQMFKSALLLSQQYNITIGGEFIGWKSVQTQGNSIDAVNDACRVISNSNIVGIVGPRYSREAQFVAPFGAKIGIPVISDAATDPDLSSRTNYPTFYRTVPPDNVAALAIAKLFIQFNWTSCIIIYQNDVYGTNGAEVVTETFNKNNLTVSDTIVFDIVTSTFRDDFKGRLTRSSTRIIILWSSSDYVSSILQKALASNVVGPQFTWISSSKAPLNSFNQIYYEKLSGMFIIEAVVGSVVNAPINRTLLDAAFNIWKQYEPESFPGSDNVNNFALFAFDATWLLIQSLQKLCSLENKTLSSCISLINTSYCFDKYFLNSTSFINTINNITFIGVSGPIQFNMNATDRINGNYYVIRNVQRSSNVLNYVPVLEWANSNDWTQNSQTNVILWPGNSLIPPTGYAIISGITLKIAVIESVPYTIVTYVTDAFGNKTPKITGYMPDLIELLRNQMGFIPNITILPSNTSYNKLINAVANGDYDLVVGDVTITSERRKKVGFSISIYDNSLRLIIRDTPNVEINFWGYLQSFTFKLWITILFVTIYAGFLISLIEREKNEALRERSIISLIALSMWFSIATVLGCGADFHVTTGAGRLLTVGLYILSIILVAAYTANLASELTISKSQSIISGIDDIKNGKISFSRIGIFPGTSMEDYYLREISNGNRNYYPLKSLADVFDNLLNNIIDAGISDIGTLEYATSNIYCNLTLVGTDFDGSAFGIAFQKEWPYQQTLDINILSLKESGALSDLIQKWFKGNYCSLSKSTSIAMPIESMVGLFVTFAAISILALLLFMWKKRHIIKDYFLSLTHKKDVLPQQNVSSLEHSMETFKHSATDTATPSNTTHF